MKYISILPFMASAAYAATHVVVVGGLQPQQAGGTPAPVLGFSPESITAAQGDVVQFMFMQKNHSVTQSTFAEPCKAMAGGKDSGFMPNPSGANNVTWEFPVETTEALWFFCAQTGHCGKGMTFAINAQTSGDKTFAAYKQLAINQNGAALTPAAIAASPAAQTASTVMIQATAGNGALNPQATVVNGQGQDASGNACTCACLCGANSFPANVAIGAFGGVAGMMGS